MNQTAIQYNSRTAWQYDQEKWSEVQERAQRYEEDLDVKTKLASVDYTEQKRIKEQVQIKFEKEQTEKPKLRVIQGGDFNKGRGKGFQSTVPQQQPGTSSTTPFKKTTKPGKDGGKADVGKGGGKWGKGGGGKGSGGKGSYGKGGGGK